MKIIIATKNKAKFEIISKMLNEIFDNVMIKSLNDINDFNEIEETGNNIERAKIKALNTFNNIKEPFDAIIGIDDGIIIDEIEYVAVKEHLQDIIISDKVPVGTKIYISRAYYLITKDNVHSYCYNKIPYIIQRKLNSYEKDGYQLNSVISTVDNPTVLTERSSEVLNDYFLKYSITDLKDLTKIISKEMD